VATARQASSSINPESVFWQMGFYGFSSSKNSADDITDRKFRLGFKFPTFLWAKALEFELGLIKTTPGRAIVTYLPRLLRWQTQVSLDSPLMTACRNGSLQYVQQILGNRDGSVHDRAICCGKTPLLVSSIPYSTSASSNDNP
jgi:hypothetical protein